MSKRSEKLAAAIQDFKEEERINTPSRLLLKIIDDYCRDGAFSDYLAKHRKDVANYLPTADSQKRPVRWRASSAGTCPQRQAYLRLFEEVAAHPEALQARERPIPDWVETVPDFEQQISARLEAPKKPTARRALYNGTFMHARYHMLFDALHARSQVLTLAAEEQHVNIDLDLSGTVDRIVAFEFEEKTYRFIIDFKSIASRYFTDLTYEWDGYARQVTTYFLLEFPCDWGMLLYENKDSQAIKIIDVPKSEVHMQMLKDIYRLQTEWVQQMHNGVKLGQRVKVPIDITQCSSCPFNRMCKVEHPERMDDILEGLPGDDVF